MLETIVLLVLSFLAVASAAVVVFHKDVVKSAIALVMHFFMLAGIYLTLSAQFLAVMQIIVYAGAIMVLVVFVIMLLNAEEEADKSSLKQQLIKLFAVAIGLGMFLVVGTYIVMNFFDNTIPIYSQDVTLPTTDGSVQAIGTALYTNYLFPLEIIGIMLLSAIIGAVMLAKKKI